MAKGIAKSIRISDEVYRYIDQAPGEGFNQKFENIILRAAEGEATREKRIAELDDRINKKQCELYELFDRYKYMDEFFKIVIRMQHQLYDMKEQLEKAMKQENE